MIVWKTKGVYKADAEKVYSEILSIGDSFSPEDIVEKARDGDTELHKCFTWDDTKAATKWREQEARVLFGNLVIKTTTSGGEKVDVRVIESVKARNTYMPTSIVVRSQTDYTDLLDRACKELKAFRIKYATVMELQELFCEIDELLST